MTDNKNWRDEALLALRAAQGREFDPALRPERADADSEEEAEEEDTATISAEFVRALLLGLPFDGAWHERVANEFAEYRSYWPEGAQGPAPIRLTAAGVRIKRASIEGALDLADCLGAGGVGLPALSIEACEFVPAADDDDPPECLNISHARLARLSLRKTRLHKVTARECLIDGALDISGCAPLADHRSARPSVDRALWRSWLSERRYYLLQCVWAALRKGVPAPTVPPTSPQRSSEPHSVTRRDLQCWFDFHGARIDGDVSAHGLRARAPHGEYALDLSDAEVLGSIQIRTYPPDDEAADDQPQGAELVGGLTLDAAQVRGALGISSALLVGSAKNCALRALGATIDGFFVLDGGSTVYGCMRLQQARIGGALQITEATLDGAGGDNALIADGVQIGADALIRGDIVCVGTLRLRNATIAGDLALNSAVLDGAGRVALEASFIEVRGAAQLCDNFTAEGEVLFAGAKIAGLFDFSSATLLSANDRPALNAENVVVGGDVLLRKLVAAGGVRLVGARIDQDLELKGATIQGRAKDTSALITAFDGAGMSIRGGLWLEANTFYGDVDLRNASATVLRDTEDGYPVSEPGCQVTSNLELDGFVYQRLHDPWQGEQTCSLNRIPWLYRMRRFAPQPYAQLSHVLEQQGLHDDALAIEAMARRREQVEGAQRLIRSQKAAKKWWLKFRFLSWVVWSANWLFGLGFGYGLKPRRAILTLTACIVLGWVMFSHIYERRALIIDQTPVASIGTRMGMGAPQTTRGIHVRDDIVCTNQIRPSLYAVDVFLPLVDLRQESLCMIGASDHFRDGWHAIPIPANVPWIGGKYLLDEIELYHYFKALYSILGWIVTSLSILTFSGAFRQRGLMRSE